MGHSDGPRGIGGWLAFYLVTWGVLVPLASGAGLYANLYADPAVGAFYGARWPVVQAINLAIGFLALAAIFYSVWRFFFRRNWQTVRIAIAVMWMALVPAPLLEVAAVSTLGGLDLDALMSAKIGSLIKPVIHITIWTAYLLRSVRVANTYPREDADEAELAEVFE